jgi:hypothetical protein
MLLSGRGGRRAENSKNVFIKIDNCIRCGCDRSRLFDCVNLQAPARDNLLSLSEPLSSRETSSEEGETRRDEKSLPVMNESSRPIAGQPTAFFHTQFYWPPASSLNGIYFSLPMRFPLNELPVKATKASTGEKREFFFSLVSTLSSALFSLN